MSSASPRPLPSLLFALGLLLGCIGGCGYRLIPTAAGPEGVLARVSLATLRNDTLDAGVDLIVVEALRRELLRAGSLRFVEDPAAADLRLSGSVLALETGSRSFSTGVRALEFDVRLRLRLVATTRDGRELRFDPTLLTEREVYLASADLEISRKNREEALRRLSQLLASRVRDRLEVLARDERSLEGKRPAA